MVQDYGTYPRHIRRRSNLGHIFWGKKSASYDPRNTVFIALFHVIQVKDRIFILNACVHMAIEVPRKPRSMCTVYFANGNAVYHFT